MKSKPTNMIVQNLYELFNGRGEKDFQYEVEKNYWVNIANMTKGGEYTPGAIPKIAFTIHLAGGHNPVRVLRDARVKVRRGR